VSPPILRRSDVAADIGGAAGVEFLLLHLPRNARNAFIQTDRSSSTPTQSRGDSRQNCLQYMRIVGNA
jgi:hypothetical protein